VETTQGGGGGWSTSVTGSASASYQREPFVSRLTYRRGVVGVSAIGSAQVQDAVSLSITWSVGERWAFAADGGYFNNSSLGSQAVGTVSGEFTSASAGVLLTRWLTSSLAYLYRTQNGPAGTGTAFSRNIVTLTLSVTNPLDARAK
jgi:hypothetical protein